MVDRPRASAEDYLRVALEAGARLGSHEIIGGGMGEVYRARDAKLGRDVAIKILPGEFALDADRLARLDREARLLAALNHPSIATIHGIEDINGSSYCPIGSLSRC